MSPVRKVYFRQMGNGVKLVGMTDYSAYSHAFTMALNCWEYYESLNSIMDDWCESGDPSLLNLVMDDLAIRMTGGFN